MNCEQIHGLLNEYVDGELAAVDREAVEQHIAGCTGCREELRALQQTAELVRSLPRMPAPQELAGAVKSRMARAAAVRRRAALARWVSVGGWIAAAATLLVVIKLVSWTPEPPTPGRDANARRETQKVTIPGNKLAPLVASPDREKDMDRTPAPTGDRKMASTSFPPAMSEAAPPSVLAAKVPEDASSAAGRMFGAGPEPENRVQELTRLEAAPGAAADTEGYHVAQPMAPATILRERSNVEKGGEDKQKEIRKSQESIPELTYLCGDAASGLDEVRRLLLAAGGTLLEPKGEGGGRETHKAAQSRRSADVKSANEKGDASEHAILAWVPADRLAWLTARLKSPGESEHAVRDATARSANGAKATVPESEALGGWEAAEGQASLRKPNAIPVRIILKIRPRSGD